MSLMAPKLISQMQIYVLVRGGGPKSLLAVISIPKEALPYGLRTEWWTVHDTIYEEHLFVLLISFPEE